MNGLCLPTGSKQPLRGDTALSISPPSQIKAESHISELPSPASRDPTSYDFANLASSSEQPLTHLAPHTSVSKSSGNGHAGLRLPSSSRGPAVALAFIPRTSRNSTAVQKPIHQCSEFELEQRLDRNERILTTLEATQTPTKDRLRAETEVIRDAIRSLRAMRLVNDGVSTVQLGETSKEAELESALLGLSVKEASALGTSPTTEAFGWSRDTVAVKKRLAQSSAAYLPGRKVQAMGYEQSLAIQSAALQAERDRERRTEEPRSKGTAAPRDKPSLGVPSGAAHRLGRKSISSCSGSMRKQSASHSVSPPKAMRAGGPFARHLDQGPEHDAALEGGYSDQDDVDLYGMPDEEEEEDPHPGPRHEEGPDFTDEDFSFGRFDDA